MWELCQSPYPRHVVALRQLMPISEICQKTSAKQVTFPYCGSEDTDQESPEVRGSRLNPKVYLKNAQGQVLALYRCIVHGKLVSTYIRAHSFPQSMLSASLLKFSSCIVLVCLNIISHCFVFTVFLEIVLDWLICLLCHILVAYSYLFFISDI